MTVRELTLDEMLADPIDHLVMAKDGVNETQVRALIFDLSLAYAPANEEIGLTVRSLEARRPSP
jgi:hypothetical protein